MTDATDTTDATIAPDDIQTQATEPAEDVQSGDAPAEPDDTEAPDDGRQDRDAAKYRRRLRDTEGERDALAAKLEALQRAAVDAQAAAEQIKPAALWASGVALADLLNDDGTVDAAKVTAAVGAARESLGIVAPRSRIAVPGEGNIPARGPAGGIDGMIGVVMGR